jgi:hypothetical protein
MGGIGGGGVARAVAASVPATTSAMIVERIALLIGKTLKLLAYINPERPLAR